MPELGTLRGPGGGRDGVGRPQGLLQVRLDAARRRAGEHLYLERRDRVVEAEQARDCIERGVQHQPLLGGCQALDLDEASDRERDVAGGGGHGHRPAEAQLADKGPGSERYQPRRLCRGERTSRQRQVVEGEIGGRVDPEQRERVRAGGVDADGAAQHGLDPGDARDGLDPRLQAGR